MSETEKPKRTLVEIQSEYQQLCTRTGHLYYQSVGLKSDLDMLTGRLRDLNLEAAAVQKAEADAKAAAEEAAKAAEAPKLEVVNG